MCVCGGEIGGGGIVGVAVYVVCVYVWCVCVHNTLGNTDQERRGGGEQRALGLTVSHGSVSGAWGKCQGLCNFCHWAQANEFCSGSPWGHSPTERTSFQLINVASVPTTCG